MDDDPNLLEQVYRVLISTFDRRLREGGIRRRRYMNRDAAAISKMTEIPGPAARRWVDLHSEYAPPSTYIYPFVWDVTRWASGPFCTDPDGNVFLDFYCHVASAPLGYNNERILRDCGVPFDPLKTAAHDTYIAVGPDPAQRSPLPMPFGAAEDLKTPAHLQAKLIEVTSQFGFDCVFLVNSGAEANSNAAKICIRKKFMDLISRYGHGLVKEAFSQLGIREDRRIGGLYEDYPLFGISCAGAFHGRTLDVLALTRRKRVQKEGYSTIRWFKSIPYNDVEYDLDGIVEETSLKELVREKRLAGVVFEQGRIPRDLLAFIIVEPIQGEGGYILADREFMHRLWDFGRRNGALMIVDEVQTGLGRTGRMWGIEHYGVVPDVITSAKALRVGAVISRRELFPKEPGAISSTWAGGEIPSAVGYKTIQIIQEENLLENASQQGEYLLKKLQAMKERLPVIVDARGKGLMAAIEIESAAKRDRAVRSCFENGLLLLGCGERSIRILPPLDVRKREIDMGLEVLEKVISGI